MAVDQGRQYKDILFEVKDQVAWITINRHTHNGPPNWHTTGSN